MPYLENTAEIDAFYLSDPAHPRAAGILWGALVERRVDKLFSIGLREDKAVHNELFQPSGALGNYAIKVRLAYLFRWIGKDVYDDLIIVSRIRNRFAHELEAKSFSDQRILAWLKNMKLYQLLPGMLADAKKEAATTPTLQNNVAVDIITDALDAPQMGFRFCISMLLRYLDTSAVLLSGPPASSEKS